MGVSRVGRRGLVLAVIGAQFCVPFLALVISEPPTRLGFQMYSGRGTLEVIVEDERGREIDYDAGEVLAAPPRVELDWSRHLPAAICEATPQAARVKVAQSGHTTVVEC